MGVFFKGFLFGAILTYGVHVYGDDVRWLKGYFDSWRDGAVQETGNYGD